MHRRRRRHGGRAGTALSTVLVIGGSRGIGLEFARQYAQAGDRVIATARDGRGEQALAALVARVLRLDVTDPQGMSALAAQLAGEKIDIALYVAGVMSRGGALQPPAQDEFDRVMRTNVWGAMQAITSIAPLVQAARGRFVFISSGMGRIAQVSSSHSWLYRTSKAALNMAVAAAQHDYPGATLVAMSPGWVRTDMGGAGAPLSVEDSVHSMRQAIAALTPAAAGAFIDQNGRPHDGW